MASAGDPTPTDSNAVGRPLQVCRIGVEGGTGWESDTNPAPLTSGHGALSERSIRNLKWTVIRDVR
jgi:hypothetical protein